MSTVNYRSTRLLVEAINQEMEAVRKAAMGNMALGPLNDLRDLMAQLIRRAERTTLDDVAGMADTNPAEYVAAMKPLVAEYHRQLMDRDLLVPALCMDLRANACIVIIVGERGSAIRAAHHPDRPDAELLVGTIVELIDDGLRRIAADASAVTEVADSDVVRLCSGCDCVDGECDCVGCEGNLNTKELETKGPGE